MCMHNGIIQRVLIAKSGFLGFDPAINWLCDPDQMTSPLWTLVLHLKMKELDQISGISYNWYSQGLSGHPGEGEKNPVEIEHIFFKEKGKVFWPQIPDQVIVLAERKGATNVCPS